MADQIDVVYAESVADALLTDLSASRAS